MKMYRNGEPPDSSKIIFVKYGKLAEVLRVRSIELKKICRRQEGNSSAGGFVIT